MIPILGITLTLLVGLPEIARNAIHFAEIERQLTELNTDCPDTGSPNPGCGRKDK